MKVKLLLTMMLISTSLFAQINLLNITPADNTTNVDLNTTISIEFDQAIDTLKGFDFFQNFFTNIDEIQATWYSSDLKIVNLGVNLEENKNYYFLVYSVTGPDYSSLENPTVVYFTTAKFFSGYTVTGYVTDETTSGLDLTNTLVALSSTSIDEGEPKIEAGAFTNSAGFYSIPNVQEGDYYPLAANDANQDGNLNPGSGDAFSFLDMTTINSNLTDLDFVLSIPDPIDLLAAFEKADSLRQAVLSSDVKLKRIIADDTDSLGNANEWEFYFTTDSVDKYIRLRIDQFGHNIENRIDEWEYQSLSSMDEIFSVSNSTELRNFVENVENAGGYEFRTQQKPANLELDIELVLADHRYSYVADQNPDTSKHIVWAAVYRWYEDRGDDWDLESEFVMFGDFETGELILTNINTELTKLPTEHKLAQNYPNPFNPETVIKYSIPNREFVNIAIYDVLGNKLETVVDQILSRGEYEINFDASNYPTGTYFYQIKTKNFTQTKKMILLK